MTDSYGDRRVWWTGDLITFDGSDTGMYGDPCEPGYGCVLTMGWVDMCDQWTVWPERDQVTPSHATWQEMIAEFSVPVRYHPHECFDLGLMGDLPLRTVAAALWLQDTVWDLIGCPKDGDIFTSGWYAAESVTTDAYTSPMRDMRLCAHPEGFTLSELHLAETFLRWRARRPPPPPL